MNLEDINKLIQMYDLIIKLCDEILKDAKVDDIKYILGSSNLGEVFKRYIANVDMIRDITINTLKNGD